MFKGFIARLFFILAGLHLIAFILNGFRIESISALILLSSSLVGTRLTVEPMLRFLTIPTKSYIVFIVTTFFFVLVLHFFRLFVSGIYIDNGSLGPFSNEYLIVPKIEMHFIAVIIFASLSLSLIDLVVDWSRQ